MPLAESKLYKYFAQIFWVNIFSTELIMHAIHLYFLTRPQEGILIIIKQCTYRQCNCNAFKSYFPVAQAVQLGTSKAHAFNSKSKPELIKSFNALSVALDKSCLPNA